MGQLKKIALFNSPAPRKAIKIKIISSRIGPAVLYYFYYGYITRNVCTEAIFFQDWPCSFIRGLEHHAGHGAPCLLRLLLVHGFLQGESPVFKEIGRNVSLFFQVFLLVVTFGLFHGLVFLPVLLCLVRTCFGLFFYVYIL